MSDVAGESIAESMRSYYAGKRFGSVSVLATSWLRYLTFMFR